MKKNNHYFAWGLTAVVVVFAIMLLYDLVFSGSSGIVMTYMNMLLGILAPILYGLIMAYLLAPIVNWIERVILRRKEGAAPAKWMRPVSVVLAWLGVLLLIYAMFSILVPELYKSVVRLADNAQRYYYTVYNWVVHLINNNTEAALWLSSLLGNTEGNDLSTWAGELFNEYYADALTWLNDYLAPRLREAAQAVTGGLLNAFTFFKNLLLGVVVSIYLLGAKENFAAGSCKMCYTLFPESRAAWVIRGTKAANKIFSGFVRGKLLDSLIIGILCFFFSSLFKFPYAPLVSVVIGVTNIIPFFGPFLGAIPSAFLILLDSPIKSLYFIIFVLVLQQFDGNILGPRILGDSTGISGFWVMVAILVGGGLWGVAGMFLGVPLFACFYTGVRNYAAYRLKKKGLPVPAANYTAGGPVWPEEDQGESPEDP